MTRRAGRIQLFAARVDVALWVWFLVVLALCLLATDTSGMNWLSGVLKTLTKPKSPSAREALEAHLAVLQEQYAPPAPVPGKHQLGVACASQGYRVVVEAGLSRLEVDCTAPDELTLHLGGDVFLSPGAEDISRHSLIKKLQLTWTRTEGAFSASQKIVTPGSGRGQRRARKDQLAQFSDRVEVLLIELLRHPKGAHYSVAIEKKVAFDNTEFIKAVRRLVKTSEQEERRQVYQSFVNSWFYVPIETVGDKCAVEPIATADQELGGKLTWTAYSDRQAMKEDKPKGDFVHASGIRIVHAAHGANIAALKLNPASKIGGEFYAHELETLAKYLDKRGIRP